ncbi:hypothetical protein PDIDSM_2977 [Penicillium digitatum]|nr:hypothetical protein PDIDSM_2977 [Penicillium digitatum]
MTDGHSAPPADTPALAPAADSTAAPVPADVRSHVHHQTAPTHDKEQVSSFGRITPRPTFLGNLATSRDTQFQLDRRNSSELERYFHGPRNMEKHSKWPIMMRMHGSIMPKMIIPLLTVTIWSTAITVFSKTVHDIGINNILLTVLGFVVDGQMGVNIGPSSFKRLATSPVQFGSMTTRWNEGKEEKSFTETMIWLLAREPRTFCRDAHRRKFVKLPPKTIWKSAGEYLVVYIAESTSRKYAQRSKKPLGHLPR